MKKLVLGSLLLGALFVGCGSNDDKFKAQADRMDEQALQFVKEKFPNGIAYKKYQQANSDKLEDKDITVGRISNYAGEHIGYNYTFIIKDENDNVLDNYFGVECYIKENKCKKR